MPWFLQTHDTNLAIETELWCPFCHPCHSHWLLPPAFYLPFCLVYSRLKLGVHRLSKLEFKAASFISPVWDLKCSKLQRHKHTLCMWHRLLYEMMKAEGRSFCDVSGLSDSWGWFQHFTGLLSCQSGARGGTGAPQEIKANSITTYLMIITKPFHSSALHTMWLAGGGSCEEIKSMKIFNECNYWIISHTVHLLRNILVTSEIPKYALHVYIYVITSMFIKEQLMIFIYHAHPLYNSAFSFCLFHFISH